MKLLINLLLIMGFLFGPALPLQAQVSVNVSTTDPVYRDIDKLVGNGLVPKIVMGQRPFSRRQIADFLAQAMVGYEKLATKLGSGDLSEKDQAKLRKRLTYIRNILDRLTPQYREELIQLGAIEGETSWYSAHIVEKIDAGLLVNNSLPRSVPDNGLGFVDATVNPLTQYRQGRHFVDGSTLFLETSHWVRASNHFALYFQPRFQLGLGRQGQPNDNDVYINNLYGKVFFKNFEIEIGRDNLFWGQGLNSGLLLSNNPRGLDMAKISNDLPFYWPWVFKYMGANKIAFFYADLGPEQNFPNAYLVGWKWNLQPLSWFELGAAFMVHSGGEGSPQTSFADRVSEVFTLNPETAGNQTANKLGGFELRFRAPPARGTEFYVELIFDDRHTLEDLSGQFKNDTGYLGGIYIPRVTNSGDVDLRLEFHKTGKRYYQHFPFVSGMTLNKFFLGDILGPNAMGFYLVVNWDVNDHHLLTFNNAFEQRSADVFTVVDPFVFVKIEDKPEENRLRSVVSWLYRVQGTPLRITTQLGYERVQNFNFISGQDRNNFLGFVNFELDLDRWTQYPKANRP